MPMHTVNDKKIKNYVWFISLRLRYLIFDVKSGADKESLK
jgi:hypothetical protein